MENEFASSAPEISIDAVDLDTIEQYLADVETALARLEAGTYWTCETTGQELPSDLLAAQPTARSITSLSYRAASRASAIFRDRATRV